jgi:antitoxin FitA
MAQLIVRNLDKAIVDSLRARAARNGRSAEAEHREILRQTLARRPVKNLKQHLLEMPEGGDEVDFRVARGRARRVDL